MSLQVNLQNLSIRLATEFKSIRTLLNNNGGDLSGLSTVAKGNLVAAINELKTELNTLAGGAAFIDDAITGTSTAWSSSKTASEIAGLIDDTMPVEGPPTDTTKALSKAAVASMFGNVIEIFDTLINDAPDLDPTEAPYATYSRAKVEELLAAAKLEVKNDLTNGASAALDTLAELATAIGNDPNFAAGIATALGNRVRFDEAQTLTAPQKAQACANIGVGDPETDFVATFNASLV